MRQFTDSLGHTWELAINVASARRVRYLAKVDLYSLVDDGARKLGELLGDPILFTEVVYHLCKESASKTPEEFCEGFGGDQLAAAGDAFFEELVDFFPNAKARESLRKLRDKSKALQGMLLARADEKMEALDLVSMAEKLTASSGSSPASSASTPDPSPSAS